MTSPSLAVLADRLRELAPREDPDDLEALLLRLATGREEEMLLAALSGHPLAADSHVLALCAEGMDPGIQPASALSLKRLLQQLNRWEAERADQVQLSDGSRIARRELTEETWMDWLQQNEIPVVGADAQGGTTDTLVLLQSGTWRLAFDEQTERWKGTRADLADLVRLTRE